MGVMIRVGDERSRMLSECTTIGRAPTCDICLTTRETSAEHAVIRWSQGRWRILDLDSRNGTRVNGRRLEGAESVELDEGTALRFGADAQTWLVTSVAPPQPFVRGSEGDRSLLGGLALPTPEDPRLQIWQSAPGTWTIEAERGGWILADREILRLDSMRWRVYLTKRLPPTAAATAAGLSIEDARLVVEHDQTEEHVVAEFCSALGERIGLGSRAHNALLLELARARLDDRERGIVSAEEGWLHRDELAQRLGLDVNHLNIMVYRVRKQLEAQGVVDAAAAVERRGRSGLLRLGVHAVSVEQLGAGG